jgi:hypothetical protein
MEHMKTTTDVTNMTETERELFRAREEAQELQGFAQGINRDFLSHPHTWEQLSSLTVRFTSGGVAITARTTRSRFIRTRQDERPTQ